MALKTKLDKVSYESLSDELKKEYIPDGDGYKLDADYEDVTGLKAKRDELLKELTDAKKAMKAFDGLDPNDVRAKLDALALKENEELAAQGKWAELEKNLRTQAAEKEAAYEKRISEMFETNAEKNLRLSLNAMGVFEDESEYLSLILRNKYIKPVEDGGKEVWKSLDDTQIIDLNTFIPGVVKQNHPKYFKADGASGSGATGSDGTGGGGKTMPHAQWKALSPKDQAAFISSGGKPVE